MAAWLVLAGASSVSAQSISGQIINSSVWRDTFTENPGDGDGLGAMRVMLLASDGTVLGGGMITSGSLPLLKGPYGYTVGSLLSNGTYSVVAWIDGDMNGQLDDGEPYGRTAVTITGSSVSNQRVFVQDDNTA
jgi:hypothetical protein